jgi:hypothetical protein
MIREKVQTLRIKILLNFTEKKFFETCFALNIGKSKLYFCQVF